MMKNSEHIEFPNEGLDPEVWSSRERNYDLLTLLLLIPGIASAFAALIGFWSIFTPPESLLSNVFSIGIIVVCIGLSVYVGEKIIHRIETKHRNKISKARMEQVPALVEGLASVGYTIGPNSITTMDWNTQPTIIDSNGNRFSTSRFEVMENKIYFYLHLRELSEKSVDAELTKLLETYEKDNGELSESDRKIFMTAAQLGFERADK